MEVSGHPEKPQRQGQAEWDRGLGLVSEDPQQAGKEFIRSLVVSEGLVL